MAGSGAGYSLKLIPETYAGLEVAAVGGVLVDERGVYRLRGRNQCFGLYEMRKNGLKSCGRRWLYRLETRTAFVWPVPMANRMRKNAVECRLNMKNGLHSLYDAGNWLEILLENRKSYRLNALSLCVWPVPIFN